MSSEAKIILALVILLGVSIYFNYDFYFAEEGENWQHKYDSIANLQDQSLARENALQLQVDSLEAIKTAHVDSSNKNVYLYQDNRKDFDNISIHIDTISDSLYNDYLLARKVPPGYFD